MHDILESFWDHYGLILKSFCYHVEMTLGDLGVTLGDVGVTSGSVWGHIILGSLWDHVAIILEPFGTLEKPSELPWTPSNAGGRLMGSHQVLQQKQTN